MEKEAMIRCNWLKRLSTYSAGVNMLYIGPKEILFK